MINKQRGLTGVVASAMLALTVVGCSSPGGSENSAATITFSGQTTEQTIWRPMFAQFEQAHPDIKIDATFTPNDAYPQLVQTRMQAGHAADIIQATPGTGGGLAAVSLAADGKIADLSGSPWAATLPAASKPLVSLDGKVYAYPTDLSPFFVAYNPALFTSAGVSVPTTFAQLMDSCRTFTAKGITPIAMAGASYQNVSILVQSLAANDVFGPTPTWNTQRAQNQVTFANSPQWQKVLADFAALKSATCFAPDVAGAKSPVHLQNFASGKAAMAVEPGQAIAQIKSLAAPGFTFSAFAFPGDTAAQSRVPAGPGIALVVNASAKDKPGVKQLLDFLSTSTQRNAYASTAGTIAPGGAADGSDVFPPALAPLKPYFDGGKAITLNYLTWPEATIAQQLSTSLQGLLTGQKSAQQILQDTDQAWNSSK